MSGFANRGPQDNLPGSAYPTGPGLFDPTLAAAGGGRTYAGAVTATPGGTRAAATKLRACVSRITVCATAGDSVALPPAVGGQVVYVSNSGAAACQIFADPSTSDTINGVAAATGVSLASGKGASINSPAAGVWVWVLSA